MRHMYHTYIDMTKTPFGLSVARAAVDATAVTRRHTVETVIRTHLSSSNENAMLYFSLLQLGKMVCATLERPQLICVQIIMPKLSGRSTICLCGRLSNLLS